MDHGVESVPGEHLAQGVRVANIRLGEFGRPAGDLRNAPDRRLVAVAEVVENDDLVPRLHQFDAGVRSDIAGAAGDQDFHSDSIVSTLPAWWVSS